MHIIAQAVEDVVTVRISYKSRLAELHMSSVKSNIVIEHGLQG
jgi:hypothetical protein